jgi:hypothetical protein
LVQVPEQQSVERTQVLPRGAHWQVIEQVPLQQEVGVLQPVPMLLQLLHWPPSQRLLQQSPSVEQLPVDLHEQVPPTPHTPPQQSLPDLHVAPVLPHWQVPLDGSQLPPQQSALVKQLPFTGLQAQRLLLHLPVQHCPSLLQEVPPALHAHDGANGLVLVSQTPEQQSVPSEQAWPAVSQHALLTHSCPSAQVGLQPPPVGTHLPPDLLKPPLQTKSHNPPLHSAVPLAGGTHGVQLEPQELGLALARHSSLQAWKPAWQLTPHTPCVQVATPCCGTGQAVHEPQCSGSLLPSTQALPQFSGALAGQ